MIHCASRVISRWLKGRTLTATLTDDIVQVFFFSTYRRMKPAAVLAIIFIPSRSSLYNEITSRLRDCLSTVVVTFVSS